MACALGSRSGADSGKGSPARETYLLLAGTAPEAPTEDQPNIFAFSFIYVEYTKNVYGWSSSAPPTNSTRSRRICDMLDVERLVLRGYEAFHLAPCGGLK